jgi:hypothetical protein
MSGLSKHKPDTVKKAGWRIPEYKHATGLSRSTIYNLLAAGEIESVKRGASRIITTPPEDYIASLPAGTATTKAP